MLTRSAPFISAPVLENYELHDGNAIFERWSWLANRAMSDRGWAAYDSVRYVACTRTTDPMDICNEKDVADLMEQ